MGTTVGTPIPSGKPKSPDPAPGSSTPSPTPATPPTNQPPAPPTSGAEVVTTAPVTGEGVPKEEFEKLQKMIRDQGDLVRSLHLQNVELSRKMREPQAPAAPQPTEAEANKAFWDNPTTSLRKMIADEMDRRVAPLNAALEETRVDKRFTNVAHEFADIWTDIEGEVRAAVAQAQAQGHQPDEQMIKVLALATSGAYYRGQLTNKPKPAAPAAAAPAAPPAPPAVDPAFLRPSAPAAPRATNGGAAPREFTEVERRLMRERGMSEAQWAALMDASPTDFLTIELPKKDGAK